MAIRVPPLKEVPWCSRMLRIHTRDERVPGGIKMLGSHAVCMRGCYHCSASACCLIPSCSMLSVCKSLSLEVIEAHIHTWTCLTSVAT